MKLGVKPLKGEPFEVEVAPDESVESLKIKVAAARPELLVQQQKLVCSGKVLADGNTLQALNVKEGDFVVVMMSKPKDPVAAAPAPAPEYSSPAAAPAAAPAAPDPAALAQAAAAAAQFEANVTNLCEMGFPRDMVEACLKAAFNSPDRAVEYLMNGIPAGAQAPLAGPPAGAPPPSAQPAPAPMMAPLAPAAAPAAAAPGAAGMPMFPPMGGGAAPAAASATGPLAQLRRHPRFEEFKHVVQNKPETLNQVLNVWLKNDPTLMKLIAEHQEEFVNMLQEPVGDAVSQMIAAAQAMQAAGGAPGGAPGAGGPAAPGGAPAPPGGGQPQIQLSAADREAIERLMSLGFPRPRAIEALLACDRNEEVAANFLFEAMEG